MTPLEQARELVTVEAADAVYDAMQTEGLGWDEGLAAGLEVLLKSGLIAAVPPGTRTIEFGPAGVPVRYSIAGGPSYEGAEAARHARMPAPYYDGGA